MDTTEILQYSKETKADAVALLKSIGLIQLLNSFGQVITGGSFEYDLMWDADIDIIVICKDVRKSSLSALNQLIEAKIAQKYEYGDFESFKRDDRPESYILNLVIPYKNRMWEVEIWFFTEIPKSSKEINDLMNSKLDSTTILEILKMKEKRKRMGMSKHSLSSVEIYKKVLA